LRIFWFVGCGVLAATFATAQTASSKTGSKAKAPKISASAIQIELIEAGDVSIPPEFRFAIYERLIERVRKNGTFPKVFRSGDREAANVPDLLTLHTLGARPRNI
jgi:hypothetical protein